MSRKRGIHLRESLSDRLLSFFLQSGENLNFGHANFCFNVYSALGFSNEHHLIHSELL